MVALDATHSGAGTNLRRPTSYYQHTDHHLTLQLSPHRSHNLLHTSCNHLAIHKTCHCISYPTTQTRTPGKGTEAAFRYGLVTVATFRGFFSHAFGWIIQFSPLHDCACFLNLVFSCDEPPAISHCYRTASMAPSLTLHHEKHCRTDFASLSPSFPLPVFRPRCNGTNHVYRLPFQRWFPQQNCSAVAFLLNSP